LELGALAFSIQSALYKKLGKESVQLGVKCIDIQQTPTKAKAFFGNGHIENGYLVIGADGFNSIVRSKLFGIQKTRYAGFTVWRGMTSLDILYETAY
jgi:FAD-dependent urate hydroxylase